MFAGYAFLVGMKLELNSPSTNSELRDDPLSPPLLKTELCLFLSDGQPWIRQQKGS